MSMSSLSYGRMMLERNRFSEAEGQFRTALQSDPEQPFALYLLAYSLYAQDKQEALSILKSSIALEPDAPYAHVLLGRIYLQLNKRADAKKALETALSLDPDDDDAYAAFAGFHASRNEWKEVKHFALESLNRDSENSSAKHYYNMALRNLNEKDGAMQHAYDMLVEDAEDSYHHETAGWACLHQGEIQQAETHFLEALRLNPMQDTAREGLKEAYRGRSLNYRAFMRHRHWLASLSEKAQWKFIIGIYIGYRILFPALMAMNLAWLGWTVFYGYIGFILWSYLSTPVGNLLLMVDGKARRALYRDERIGALLIPVLALTGVPLFIFATEDNPFLWRAGLALFTSAIVFCLALPNRSPLGKPLFLGVGSLVLFWAGLMLWSQFQTPLFSPEQTRLGVMMCGYSVLASTILANFKRFRHL